MSILKFLPIFIGGMLLCGCESGSVMTEPENETLDQEISRVEKEDFVSMTDKENCFLCGSNRPRIFDYYEKDGCIALVCLNTWNIADTNMTTEEGLKKNQADLARISIRMERMNAAGWWQVIRSGILQRLH